MIHFLQRKKSKSFFAVSALIHIFLLVATYLYQLPKHPKNQVIEIQLREEHPRQAHQKRSKGSLSSKTKNKASTLKSAQHNISNFLPQYKLETNIEGQSSNSNISKTQKDSFYSDPKLIDQYTLHDNEKAYWGVGGGTFERVQDYQLMSQIYQTVEEILFYPSVLVSNRIAGGVTSRLVINKVGECDWEKTQINSSDAHLKVYVLYVLQKTCSQSFKKYIAQRTSTNVDMTFEFALTEHNDRDLIDQQKYIVGNVLAFYRNSQTSMMKWELGPFEGIFPVPLVNINFRWLQKNWNKYINNIDELEQFKSQNSPN